MNNAYWLWRVSKDPDDTTTDGMWCAQNNINIKDLLAWKKEHPEFEQKVLEARRSRYAAYMNDVDAALFMRAKAGDTRAAELLYRRFESWTPKQAEEELKKNPKTKTFAQLIEESAEDKNK